MNVDLRLKYKEETNDHGALSEAERKDRYIEWLEDRVTETEKALFDTDKILREVHFRGERPAPFPTRSQLDANTELFNK